MPQRSNRDSLAPAAPDRPKPLWRFGPAGWVFLAIAVALAAGLIAGVDGQTLLITAIHRTLGDRAMYWFVLCGLPFHSLDFIYLLDGAPPSPRFGLLTLCLTLVALGLHPRRFRLRAYLALILLGVVLPPMMVQTSVWISRMFWPEFTAEYWPRFAPQFTARLAAMLVTAVVMHAITRSWLITGYLVLSGALAAIVVADSYATNSGGFSLSGSLRVAISWAWNPALFALLLWWAIRARRTWKPPWACRSCGYDLRGSPDRACPECGRTAEPAPG